jgi:hypothetical protein
VAAFRGGHDALQMLGSNAQRAIVDPVEAVTRIDSVCHKDGDEGTKYQEQLLSNSEFIQENPPLKIVFSRVELM